MSASTHSTHAPAALAMPALRCALRSGPAWITRSARRSATALVPSELPLSTTISSTAGQVWARIDPRQVAIVRTESRVGTTTETSCGS